MGIDLTLADIYYGGDRLPFLGDLHSASRIFPKYDGGLFKEGDKTMILSRG